MADFLLELFSEEIPARMQPAAAAQLKAAFEALLADAGLRAEVVETHATPRRLALIARGIPAASEATSEERRGPKVDAPAQAIEGFLKSTGLSRGELHERDTGKGVFLFAVIGRAGRPAGEILAEKLPGLVAGFSWPKSQRWGPASISTASPRWVRPLRGIVALLDADVVPFEALGVASGRETFGHRFMGDGKPISVESPARYAEQLADAFVVLSADERRATVREGALKAAEAAGLRLRIDEGLEAENAGLTEWPVPLLGKFDPAFLEVPPEIIQLTMRTNQKYFAVEHADGTLAPAFVCVANLVAADGGKTIVSGNERVLSARLADARFFWDQDRKIPLEKHAEKLKDIVFHEKLGTMADKVERVAKLARWLVESGAIPNPAKHVTPEQASPAQASPAQASPAQAGVQPDGGAESDRKNWIPAFAGMTDAEFANEVERAARLAKADLTTGTVGEFPELQGIVGSYLAQAQGENPGVVSALKQHYAPVPEGCISVAVALADRLDTLTGFFGMGLSPTGSSDPFALRRAAISVIGMLALNGTRLHLSQVHAKISYDYTFQIICKIQSSIVSGDVDALTRLGLNPALLMEEGQQRRLVSNPEVQKVGEGFNRSAIAFVQFFADRLKVQQREAGVRHDLIDAVFALGGEDDLVRLLARVKALQDFVATEDGVNLLAGYKRAVNILRIEEKKDGQEYALGSVPLSQYIGETEKNLAAFFVAAEGAGSTAFFDEADALFAREDFAGAMRNLASLRAPVDAFFEGVTVNDRDPEVRVRRLGLLAAIREAMHRVADFSKIEGA